MIAPTSVALVAALGHQYVVLLTALISRDTVRGFVCLATVLQQQPQSFMPYQAYAIYIMGPHMSFLFES